MQKKIPGAQPPRLLSGTPSCRTRARRAHRMVCAGGALDWGARARPRRTRGGRDSQTNRIIPARPERLGSRGRISGQAGSAVLLTRLTAARDAAGPGGTANLAVWSCVRGRPPFRAHGCRAGRVAGREPSRLAARRHELNLSNPATTLPASTRCDRGPVAVRAVAALLHRIHPRCAHGCRAG